ncbi:hypothetical protein ACFFNX_11690 [Actinoallomurus acaciae]|uniref:Uncharacterized protein n=1 Tax=Actinoallomurus acaciae TaxID=502577 RepID=A0ABV5YCS6_9ACTN
MEAARSTKEILAAVVQHVFGALLMAVGDALANYGLDRTLDPAEYAIPVIQRNAIISACQDRADAFGARAEIALALANLMPDGYDDPTVTVALRPTIDHRPREHVLTVLREATDVIAAASAHCDKIGAFFGNGSLQHLRAVLTLQRGICTVFSMAFGAGTRITRRGPMSLLITSSSGYVYGLDFHPDPRICLNPGCGALIDANTPPSQTASAPCPAGRHRPSYPAEAPQPGVWQLHS